MNITAIKTRKLIPGTNYDLLNFIDESLDILEEDSVVTIASKVVAICQGRAIPITAGNEEEARLQKLELIKREADSYHEPEKGTSSSIITIKKNVLQIAAGVDESNANKYFIPLPTDLQNEANKIRTFLRNKFNLRNLGVIITDSRSTPLRRGVVGVALAYSGFKPITSYIGENDLFGREMKISETNLIDCLASAAIAEMGEGSEQTPIVIIKDIRKIEFQADNPSPDELRLLCHDIEHDLYFDLIDSVEWKSGNNDL